LTPGPSGGLAQLSLDRGAVVTTQTVTVLFTDMVGSTELSSRLDPEAANRFRQNHFSLLRQALAATDGAEVKNLGDGLMAVFSTPSAALDCAVAMQQAIEVDNRHLDDPLGLRIGVSGGEVTIEDDDYFGDPVVEAARLCALCRGGQILVTDTVTSMAGRRSAHPSVDLGKRELRGLPEPVAVLEITWEPVSGAMGVPLPERLETPNSSLFGFSGREPEQARLTQSIKSTAEGTRRVIFLSGEPGIGKTSLCRRVAQSAYDLNVCVLYGRCDDEIAVSYQPFAEALTHLVLHSDESLLKDHIAENSGVLLSLVPSLSKRIPDAPATQSADPDTARLRLFSAVVALLSSASANGGLLLVLDDLHWADRASLQLLRYVVTSTELPKVMVLGTYRDSELAAGNPLSDTLATLRREADVERLRLTGLGDLEIVEMMEQVAGHEMDQEGVALAHAVRRETGGNPFFTTELLRHLGEAGLVHQDETGRWVASDDLYKKGYPQSVREVVGQRVDRLGEDMRRLLSHASVIGQNFDIEVLALVADMKEELVLDLIDEAAQHGLVTEDEGAGERYSFAHALMQHALYEDLATTRRARIHRKVAEVLEQLYGGAPEMRAAELAHHFVAATKAADTMKALKYSMLAGEQALAHLAPIDALGWFVRALDLYAHIPPDEGLHCDLLIGTGTAQRRAGDPGHRQTLLDAAAIARNLGDADRIVASALANSRGSVTAAGLVDHEKVAVVEEALTALEAGDSVERALLTATLSTELSFSDDPQRGLELGRAALAMARRLKDPATLLRVTVLAHQTTTSPETLNDRLSDLAQATAVADSFGDPVARYHAHLLRALAFLQAADTEGCDNHLSTALALADRLGQPFERWHATIILCSRTLLSGHHVDAEIYANKAFAIGSEAVPEAMAVFGAQLLAVYRISGATERLREMAELMAGAVSENPGLPILRAILARTYCDLGQDDDAVAVIGADLADSFALFPHDPTWANAMAAMAEICVHFDHGNGARLLYEWLRPWHAQVAFVHAGSAGPIAFHLGSLATTFGNFDEAQRRFKEALAVGRKLQSPYWVARTQLSWAKMQLRCKTAEDTGEAKSKLDKAVRSARQNGFGAIEREATALLGVGDR